MVGKAAAKMLSQLSLLALVAMTGAVDLKTCNANIQARLANNSLSSDDEIFHWNGTNRMSNPSNLQLTIQGCNANCPKTGTDLYPDMWPRLLTWLLPALLLIGNLHLPRVGTANRLLVVIHFLGDPVDSMWALLTKGEVWNRFYEIAKKHTPGGTDHESMSKAFAAMLSAFEELTGDMATVKSDLDAIMAENAAQLSRRDMEYILKETADELVDSRSNEVLRSLLVILNYLWTVVAALVPAIGGDQSTKPGGRIGTAMFLSWLVTGVLLSNTLSGFSSRRTCLRIMERYCRTVKGRKRDVHYFPNSPHLAAKARTILDKGHGHLLNNFIDAQPWNGGVYSYRRNKRLISSETKGDKSPLYLLAISVAPLIVATACAFVIIYFTPNVGLGCRTVWVLSITSVLLVSPVVTALISRMVSSPRAAWYLTVLKDALICIPYIAVIIISSIGVFNTCWCWSAVYSYGYANAFVILDPLDERTLNGSGLYPGVAGACLIAQIIVYFLMYGVMRPGAKVFRIKEEEKMEQYSTIHGHGSMDSEMLPPPALSPNESPAFHPQRPSPYLAPARPATESYFGPPSESRSSMQPLLGGSENPNQRWR